MRYEIIINTNSGDFYLDTKDTEAVELSYSIAEIQDISKRNSSYSKTITLPETPNNRNVFDNISDLSIDSTFNPNKKSRCRILLDTLLIFDGYLQLKKVILDDINGNRFEVVIFAENDNFFTQIGDSFLTDLDFSNYNHIYGTTSIIDSWTADYNNGYFYPLIDYGYNWVYDDISGTSATVSTVNINEMYPSTYVRTIWDKIFSEAGYTYQSSFINNNPTSVFNQLIIPFINNKLLAVGQEDPNFIFNVGASGTQSVLCYSQITTTTPSPAGVVTFKTSYGLQTIDFPVETFPYSDPSSQWNINEYTQVLTPNYVQRFKLRLNCSSINGAVAFSWLKVSCYRQFNPDGTLNPNWASGTGYIVSTSANYIQNTTNLVFNTPYFDDSIPALTRIYPGEKVRFKVDIKSTVYGGVGGVPVPTSYTYNIGDTMTNIISGDVTNEIDSTILIPGQTINHTSAIPNKIKQSDFIISIARMFNLYIDKDPNNDNKLIIETRNDYYNLGNGFVKDWTQKLDISKPIEETIIADLTNRQIVLTYKDDKDYWNTYYKSVFNEIYGQYLYDTENDFTKGQKKIELIFSPTPLVVVDGSSSLIIPKISKDTQNYNSTTPPRDNYNIRILRRYTNLLPIETSGEYFSFNGVQYTQYPYAGHYDNPYITQEDINFGILKDTFIPIQEYTGNNLYKLYYEDFFNEIYSKDSRIITASLYLTSEDISQFRFWDIINLYFNGSNQYYRVNKISGFNPLFESTCTVELIKIIDSSKFIGEYQYLDKVGFNSVNSNFTNIVTSFRNTLNGNRNIITGKDNYIQGNNNLLIGDSNILDSFKSISKGDNNQLNNINKSITNGDGNQLNNINKSSINGDNNIVNDGELIFIDNDYNIISNSNNIKLFGLSNSIYDSSMVILNGNDNYATFSSYLNIIGGSNSISNSNNLDIIGSNNIFTGTNSNITFIGDNTTIDNKSDLLIVSKESMFKNDVTFDNYVTINSDVSLSNIDLITRTSSTTGYTNVSAQVVQDIQYNFYIKVICQAIDKANKYIYTSDMSAVFNDIYTQVGTTLKTEFSNFPISPVTNIISTTSSVFVTAYGVTGSNINWKFSIQSYQL